MSSQRASGWDPATLSEQQSLGYEPHPCGSPFGPQA